MELPEDYKKLYKHWQYHTLSRESSSNVVEIDYALVEDIKDFINERMHMFERKETHQQMPYANDHILNTYRFCNIYRELDRQTVFYHQKLKPFENDFGLWVLNMLFCRSICSTETIEKVGLLSFNKQHNERVFEKLSSLPSPKYGTAYVFPVSAIQRTEWNTREKFFCRYYPMIIPQVSERIRHFHKNGVADALADLLPIFEFNLKFLWTEVLIDIAYQYPELIDLYNRFPIGPGSRPTFLRLNRSLHPESTNQSMIGKFDKELDLLTIDGKKVVLSAENWEGIGCEFRKYSNLKLGKGRKRIYSR